MASEFNRILALLRKERGITQKQAAADLGISQAQLSHYEKGIRECSLAFVVQVADYYGVSCDYLLGRSADRSGQTISVADLPETGASTSGSVYRGSVLPTMYKKLIENSLDILYDKLQESKDKQLVIQISQYLMLAVYKVFRRLYDASPKNAVGMFRVGAARWQGNADAAMHVAEAELAAALTGEDGGKDSLDPATLSLSTERLTQDYPRHATSLLNLVKNAEESMRRCTRRSEPSIRNTTGQTPTPKGPARFLYVLCQEENCRGRCSSSARRYGSTLRGDASSTPYKRVNGFSLYPLCV